MKIGIIGYGVTGSALAEYLMAKNENIDLVLFDPPKGIEGDLTGCKFIFICVPTPVLEDGSQDKTILINALSQVPKDSVAIIRSTVVPGTTKRLAGFFNRPIAHLPEFLTERTSRQDMFDQKELYLGYEGTASTYFLLEKLFPDKRVHYCSSLEAEMIKYTHNCFGAMKVTFFNAIFDFCAWNSVDYNFVREGILNVTEHINAQHTSVPGPDGKKGYGGKCYPDNVKSMARTASTFPLGHILALIDELNKGFRNENP